MMKKLGFTKGLLKIVLSASALLALPALYGQTALLRSDYPASYIVQDSDTLWEIAGHFLQDPQQWDEIWQPDVYLDNPDLIYPGDILKISLVGGSPRILLQRGDRDTVSLGPEIREEPLLSAIPAIPLESIENSFTRNRITTQEAYASAPYIVSNVTSNLIIGTGDEVYARGQWPEGTSSFEIYREGRIYMDDEDELPLGVELEYLGFTTITADVGPDLKRILINNSSKEIKVGDRLLVREETRLGATIYPSEPEQQMNGVIVAFLSAESLASQLDTVVIDLGTDDSLEVGNILSIQGEGPYVVDETERERMTFRERVGSSLNPAQLQLPGKEVGTLLVYKTFEQLSYALILNSLEPTHLNDKVVNP